MQGHSRIWIPIAVVVAIGQHPAAGSNSILSRDTFSRILSTHDVVVIARRQSSVDTSESTSDTIGAAEFQVTDLLAGDLTQQIAQLSCPIRLADADQQNYLLQAVRRKNGTLYWNVALPLTMSCQEHLRQIVELPSGAMERLAFYRDNLNHSDPMISINAHLELWAAPDDEFAKVSVSIGRETLRRWLGRYEAPDQPQRPVQWQRLYLAMLAQCATVDDAPWLAERIVESQGTLRATSRSKGQRPHLLDAWIACYLMAAGDAGLPLVNRLFLNNSKADYVDVYFAIKALRFVRDQPRRPVSRSRMIESIRHALDNELIADIAVGELARLEDWESLDRIVQMIQNPGNAFIDVPVINFVRACPLPESKSKLKQLKESHAKQVKRAQTFWPTTTPSGKRRPARIRESIGGSTFRC